MGSGRSGTTFLAKCLQDAGVNMGTRMYYDLCENLDFVNINKAIYEEAGTGPGIGMTPPKKERIKALKDKYTPLFRQAIKKNATDFWGVKEPRFSMTAPIVMPLILETDDDPFIYIAVRKPEKIADSLVHMIEKQGFSYSKEQGEFVAKEYYRRIIEFMKDYLDL